MKTQKTKTIKYVNDKTKRVIIENSYSSEEERKIILAIMKFLKKRNTGKYSIVED